ncbi:MAG: glycosyltransferase [Pseudomonadota bacterium]
MTDTPTPPPAQLQTDNPIVIESIGAVVIGRNEGTRLDVCLASLAMLLPRVVYVDSGSTDDSLDIAAKYGVTIVQLDMSKPFTAARARNAGWRKALEIDPAIAAIQFVDGDCEVIDTWLDGAAQALQRDHRLAAVCGRRKERFPDASVYNYLCDVEWNTPVGEARAVGGDALIRVTALSEVNGYDDGFIAGEEPEMCVRMRAAGWRIRRLDQDMTWHDANIMRFGQWWTRARRTGYAFALGASRHGRPPERHHVKETTRAVIWGAAIPLTILVLSLFKPAFLALTLIFPVQILRLALRMKLRRRFARALFLTVGKFAEAQGILHFYVDTIIGRQKTIIEYKSA